MMIIQFSVCARIAAKPCFKKPCNFSTDEKKKKKTRNETPVKRKTRIEFAHNIVEQNF